MIDSDTNDRRNEGTPLAAETGVIFATREMLVDGLAIVRETVRREPLFLVAAFLLGAVAAGILCGSGRRR